MVEGDAANGGLDEVKRLSGGGIHEQLGALLCPHVAIQRCQEGDVAPSALGAAVTAERPVLVLLILEARFVDEVESRTKLCLEMWQSEGSPLGVIDGHRDDCAASHQGNVP